MKQEKLQEILKLHGLWLDKKEGGKQANLSKADLSYADLTGVDLRHADLSKADLSNANLTDTDLSKADLSYVNLSYAGLSNADLTGADLSNADLNYAYLRHADFRHADLRHSDLTGANLTDTDLSKADFRHANLRNADFRRADLKDLIYNSDTSFFALQCPEKGSFIGWKKADGMLIELLITEDALRSSATSRKCRCSKAKVLEITDIKTGEEVEKVSSDYDSGFIYKKGEIVAEKNFDKDRWNECTRGIHFFITKQEAINY